ncbi:MAG: ABC transporter substrate-binding protein, partial [Pseudomonadota bacterium]
MSITRKTLRLQATRLLTCMIAALALSAPSFMARAQDQQAIVVVAAPLTGTYKPLGDLFLANIDTMAADNFVVPIDTACNAETAAGAAAEIVALEPAAVIGLPCIDAFDALAPILAEAGIPITAVGLQTPDVTNGKNGLVRRVAPTSQQIYRRLATHLADAWRDVPFAIVDDGTLSGRQLAEQVGALLAEASLTPVFRDTYRPLLSNQTALVRRLDRAGTR